MWKRLLEKTVMTHTRNATLYVTPEKCIYEIPLVFSSESSLHIVKTTMTKQSILVETILPAKNIVQQLDEYNPPTPRNETNMR